MGTSVAHDPSRICALDVQGFSCAAQCAPSAPTFLTSLYFFDSVSGECPSNPQGITTLVRQSLDQGFFHAGLFRIPRVRFHIGHVGDGEERHGKARVLTCIVVLFGKREKRSDGPAQIRLFTTQVI